MSFVVSSPLHAAIAISGKLQEELRLRQYCSGVRESYTVPRTILEWFWNHSSLGSVLEQNAREQSVYTATGNYSRTLDPFSTASVNRCISNASRRTIAGSQDSDRVKA